MLADSASPPHLVRMNDPISRLNAALEGGYHIERELGEGGMARVYLADDIKHERKVALKVLKPELAAASVRTQRDRRIQPSRPPRRDQIRHESNRDQDEGHAHERQGIRGTDADDHAFQHLAHSQ